MLVTFAVPSTGGATFSRPRDQRWSRIWKEKQSHFNNLHRDIQVYPYTHFNIFELFFCFFFLPPEQLPAPLPAWLLRESLESESEKFITPEFLSFSSFKLSWKLAAWYCAYLAIVVCDLCEIHGHTRFACVKSQFSSDVCITCVRTSIV